MDHSWTPTLPMAMPVPVQMPVVLTGIAAVGVTAAGTEGDGADRAAGALAGVDAQLRAASLDWSDVQVLTIRLAPGDGLVEWDAIALEATR